VAPPFAPSPFFFLSSARAPRSGTASVGYDVAFLRRPVVLHAASPDPSGRDQYAVGDVVDMAVTASFALVPRLELGAALPFSFYRTGTGLTGVTSQSGPDLTGPALRDLRLGAGYALVGIAAGSGASMGTFIRLDLSLPT